MAAPLPSAGDGPAVPGFDRAQLEHSVPHRLAQVAAAIPEHPALRTPDRFWTYRELMEEVRGRAGLVHGLPAAGSGCAAYLVDHSPEMVFCALGIMASGRASLGIHPGQPGPAQRGILDDAAPEFLFTDAAHETRAHAITSGTGCRVIRCDAAKVANGVSATGNAFSRIGAGRPAVLFYTSGSTGRPKGLVKSHRAVLHRAWLAGQVDGVSQTDRVSLLTFGSFASSEGDLFGALLQGATLCPMDVAAAGWPALTDWIEAMQITVLHPPVLLFRRWLQGLDPGRVFPSIRVVALAGDVVRPQDLRLWQRHFSRDCVLMHRFSTTETGMLAVDRIQHGNPVLEQIVPAGRSVPDKTVEVVDDSGNPVTPGQEGGLRVRSRYLADGLWRRPEGAFREVRIAGQPPGVREYDSGDRVRFLADGRLVFLGRRDHQVKLRGYRVELAEIEEVLAGLSGIRECAVLVDPREDAGRLVAFVVTGLGAAPAPGEIRDLLKNRLAEWKVPSEFVFRPLLPVTPTGKVDRLALAASLKAAEAAVESDSSGGETDHERELMALWARALGRRSVGLDDDFRDLGGHSLQAMDLARSLERLLGRPVSIAELLTHASVRRFAASLTGTPVAARAPGRRFRGAPGGSPWIHVPGIYGLEFLPAPLAAVIGRHRPYFDGLQVPGFDGRGRLPDRIESMAAELVLQLESLNPGDSIVISGYSFGGLVAFETARQWAALGRSVERVVLLDTAVHGARRRRSPGGQIRELMRRFGELPLRRRVPALSRFVMRKFGQWGREGIRRLPFRTPALAERQRAAARAAKRDYRPGSWPGPVELLRALRPTLADTGLWEIRPDNGWSKVLHPGLRIHSLDCDHEQMFFEPLSPRVLDLLEDLASGRMDQRLAEEGL